MIQIGQINDQGAALGAADGIDDGLAEFGGLVEGDDTFHLEAEHSGSGDLGQGGLKRRHNQPGYLLGAFSVKWREGFYPAFSRTRFAILARPDFLLAAVLE